MYEQIVILIKRARQLLGDSPSWIDIEHCFDLQICTGSLPEDKDGAYLGTESKIVLNNKVTSKERQQFTLYHELVHHLIREDEHLYSYLHDAYEDADDFDNAIETICNAGAAELILPREFVYKLINTEGFSVNLVPRLCDQRNASGPAALIQLIQCAPNRCYGVVCEFGQSPIQSTPNQYSFVHPPSTDHLYILYTMRSPSTKYSLARWTIIPNDHLLMEAYNFKKFVDGQERIPFRSRTDWQAPCQALFFRGKVYGVFNVTPPPNNQQPRLL